VPRTGPGRLVWVTVAIILISLMMRTPIVEIAPVIGNIQADLGISASVAGLLTSIPVLCFAVATPFAVWIVRRGGTTFAVTVLVAGTLVGWVLRSSGGIASVLIGTALIGVFITIGNVVLPVVIRREYSPHRAGIMTGVYISALNVGSMVVTVGTAPLEPTLGWRGAILVWAVFAVAALAVWIGLNGWRRSLVPQATAHAPRPGEHLPPRVFRSLTIWLLAVAFAGQAFGYYGVTAWLPKLLADEQGVSASTAGAIASIFQIAAILGALGSPLIARRRGGLLPAIATIGLLWLTVPLGFLFAPGLWGVWSVLGGAAQGGGLTVILIISSAFSRDDRHAAAINALVQATGYTIAAFAPTIVGAVRDATGDWTAPLLVVLAAVLTFGVLGSVGAVRVQRRPLPPPP